MRRREQLIHQVNLGRVIVPVNFALTHTRVPSASFSSVPPLWVEVQGERRPLSAGRPYDIKCQVIGARPLAIVTWRLDDKRLTSHSEKVSGSVFYRTGRKVKWEESSREIKIT